MNALMTRRMIFSLLKKLSVKAATPQGKAEIVSSFTNKVDRVGGVGQLMFRLKTMYRYFLDPTQSKAKKAMVGGALLYFIFPLDVVSDFIPLLGYMDDATAIAIIWRMMSKELDVYEKNILDNHKIVE